MGLLQDIVEGARGSTVTAAELLRSVRVLASRGNADDLAEWVKRELSGYEPDDVLPSYRGPFPAHAMGHFSGPFGSEANVAIPDFGFPESMATLFKIEFRGPIVELENMLAGDTNNLAFVWPANAVVITNRLMEQGKVARMAHHSLVSVSNPIMPNVLITAIDGVRNQVLELALELERLSPELGTVVGAEADHKEEISAKFNQVIFAHQVQVGETFSPNYGVSITAGDVGSLDRYLEALGVARPEDRQELIAAANDARSGGAKDAASDSKLRAAIRRAASSAGKMGAKAADVLIEAVIKKWLET